MSRFEIPYLPVSSLPVGIRRLATSQPSNGRSASTRTYVNGPSCVDISKTKIRRLSRRLVQASFAYLNQRPDVPRIITIACFNEWSEGHYLLPDNRFGYGMLEALAEALGKEGNQNRIGRQTHR